MQLYVALLALLALVCCRAALATGMSLPASGIINTGQFDTKPKDAPSRPTSTRQPASNAVSNSRILEFQILGLFNRRDGATANSTDMLLSGSQVVENNFAAYALYAGYQLPVTSFNDSEYFTVTIGQDQELDNLVILARFNASLPSNSSRPRICSLRAALGKLSCSITDAHFLEVQVRERVHLRNCKQSSQSDPAQGCELVYDMDNRLGGASARCSVTDEATNSWWQASAVLQVIFFESVGVFADKKLNHWTRNFDISVDRFDACVSVTDGQPFSSKVFPCGQFGSSIGVVTRGHAARLAICEIAVYGYETGCADWQSQTDNCRGSFVSHIGYGRRPFPHGLECRWTLVPVARTNRLLLQFPEFKTGSEDLVVIYNSADTTDPSSVLAKYQGSAFQYDESQYFGARYHVSSGNVTNYLTVHFKSSSATDAASLPRTVASHRGFRISYIVIKDDFYGEQKHLLDTYTRICYPGRYVESLLKICINRGGINPVYLYGRKTGGPMLRNMEKQFNATGQRPRTIVSVGQMEAALGVMTHKLPEVEEDLTGDRLGLLCAAYSNRRIRYIDECCCNNCNMRYLSQYCIIPYEPITTGCAVNATTSRGDSL